MNDVSLYPLPPANLLFVDDEPNVLKALKRLFRSSEYHVHLAESGAEGLAILSTEAIDLIISDMRMPQMSGAEFLALAAESWPDTVRILLTGFADLESTIAAVNQGKIYSYRAKPWEDNELKILVNNALEQKHLRDERTRLFDIINDQNAQLKDLNANLEEKVEQRTAQLKKSLQLIDNAHVTLKKQYTDSIKTFAKIIEMRPGIKSGHAKYIAENARNIARQLCLDGDQCNDILYAGLLLQIGKMSLPDALLMQSFYAMTNDNKKRYLKHAQEGRSLLKGIDRLKAAALLICHQYEHYDGSGYPQGLVGTDIPLGARILTVVRDYVEYLDGSITGFAMPTDAVKKRLVLKKNRFYDPEVVDIFLDLIVTDVDANANDERPVIEVSWTQLQIDMEVEEVSCNGILYLKDRVLTQKIIDEIINLQENGNELSIKIRLGHQAVGL